MKKYDLVVNFKTIHNWIREYKLSNNIKIHARRTTQKSTGLVVKRFLVVVTTPSNQYLVILNSINQPMFSVYSTRPKTTPVIF